MAIYAISDLHGRKDKYDAVLDQLKENDHLYILGDVIDRGKDGIAILLDIMQRSNVTLLMGNHEKMMIDFLRADEDGVGSEEDYAFHFKRWNRNGCDPTIQDYYLLDKKQRKHLRGFLENLPYAICDLEVNGRIFYLCHAYPNECLHGTLYAKDLSEDEQIALVWKRFQFGEIPYNQRINVVGHTPTPYYLDVLPVRVYEDVTVDETSMIIDIDCNLASRNDHEKVGLLCLDNLDVCYL